MYDKPKANVEVWRKTDGRLKSDASFGNNGCFEIRYTRSIWLTCIVSDGAGWEHVSVTTWQNDINRTPTWKEMCFIKDLFWPPTEWVVQYHPSEKEYVNCHPHVLHLWRPLEETLPTPPADLVGIPGVKVKGTFSTNDGMILITEKE